jgi:peptide/nickel transport system ATP-binding protein
MSDPLLELDNVSKHFIKRLDLAERIGRMLGAEVAGFTVRAVNGVSFAIHPGEVVGLVGESGCGKSTLGRIVAGLHDVSAGTVRWRGKDLGRLRGHDAKDAALRIQMVFQDPLASLNPRMTASAIIGEAPRFHGLVRGSAEADDYVAEMMARVGLDPTCGRRYPHQFSGGQRQRIGIARALAVKPDLLVCDEAVSALDVSVQAQVINLFMDLRRDFGLTYLFISHDVGVVRHVADRIVVMYLGLVMEMGPNDDLFARPSHPYTRALLEQVPHLGTRRRRYMPIQGEIPSPLSPPSGCSFNTRCPYAMERCRVEVPALKEIAPGRRSACHLNDT